MGGSEKGTKMSVIRVKHIFLFVSGPTNNSAQRDQAINGQHNPEQPATPLYYLWAAWAPVSCLCPVSNPSNHLTPRWLFRSISLTAVRNQEGGTWPLTAGRRFRTLGWKLAPLLVRLMIRRKIVDVLTKRNKYIELYYTKISLLHIRDKMFGVKRFCFPLSKSYGNTRQRRDFTLISKGTTLFRLSLSTNGATTFALDKVPTVAPLQRCSVVKCHGSHQQQSYDKPLLVCPGSVKWAYPGNKSCNVTFLVALKARGTGTFTFKT